MATMAGIHSIDSAICRIAFLNHEET